MFRKIKQLISPTKYLLKDMRYLVNHELRELNSQVRQILIEQKKSAYYRSQSFENHLEGLAHGRAVTEDEISFSFQEVSRRLEFQIAHHDLAKPVICTVALGEGYRAKVAPCLNSQRDYCRLHGYAYAELNLPPDIMVQRPASWYKIPLVFNLLQRGYQTIFYIDADALVTNPSIKVDGFVDKLSGKGKELLLTEDHSGINMGIFLIKSGPAILRLLDLIWNYDVEMECETWEQNALRKMLKQSTLLQKPILIEERQKSFNSFPKERIESVPHAKNEANNWTEGDFICHFSGIRSPDLERLIAEYSRKISSLGSKAS